MLVKIMRRSRKIRTYKRKRRRMVATDVYTVELQFIELLRLVRGGGCEIIIYPGDEFPHPSSKTRLPRRLTTTKSKRQWGVEL